MEDDSIQKLFRSYIFAVPDYQRAYAWETAKEKNEKRQLETFWDDVFYQKSKLDKSRFYLGSFLFEDTGKKKVGYTKYYVVDGQQRLITLAIFMRAVLDKLGKTQTSINKVMLRRDYIKDDDAGVAKLHAIKSDDTIFQPLVIEKELSLPTASTLSHKRLINAKRFFIDRMKEISVLDLERMVETVENAKIIIHDVSSPLEATQIFEFQNDRGKDLTDLETLKSFLMHRVYLCKIGDESDVIGNLLKKFESIYRLCEKIEALDKRISEDNILLYHCIAYEGIKTGKAKNFLKQKARRLLIKGKEDELINWI